MGGVPVDELLPHENDVVLKHDRSRAGNHGGVPNGLSILTDLLQTIDDPFIDLCVKGRLVGMTKDPAMECVTRIGTKRTGRLERSKVAIEISDIYLKHMKSPNLGISPYSESSRPFKVYLSS